MGVDWPETDKNPAAAKQRQGDRGKNVLHFFQWGCRDQFFRPSAQAAYLATFSSQASWVSPLARI